MTAQPTTSTNTVWHHTTATRRRHDVQNDYRTPLKIQISSFRQRPEPSAFNRLDTGLRRCDELLEVPYSGDLISPFWCKGKLTFYTSKTDGTMRKVMDVLRIHALGWKHTPCN